MKKTTLRLLTVAAVLMLTGCVRDPYMFQPYYQPAPVPLQPYVEPLIAPPPAVHRRTVRHRHHRRHYRQPLCPCALPVR